MFGRSKPDSARKNRIRWFQEEANEVQMKGHIEATFSKRLFIESRTESQREGLGSIGLRDGSISREGKERESHW